MLRTTTSNGNHLTAGVVRSVPQSMSREDSSMKRVLIVASAFHPAMMADMHRARLLCQELPALGWQCEVLAPDVSYQWLENVEPDSAPFFLSETIVHTASLWRAGVFRRLGIGSIGWRALWPMYRRGCQLLATGNYDLVYFTTTSFNLFCLGRLWRRFGVPFVLDFQDPWYRTTYKYVTSASRWKFKLARWSSRFLEAFAVRRAAGIVSVSSKLLDDLLARYAQRRPPWIEPGRHATIPFAAAERDRQVLHSAKAETPDADRKLLHVVYVGAGGAIMAESVRALCRAIVTLQAREPALVARLRIDFYGTVANWKPGDGCFLKDIARSEGAAEGIDEHPGRQTYRRSLELAESADGLLVLGVDDAGYVPSKLFSYLLFGKPVLACFHESSPAGAYLEQHPGLAGLIRFGGREDPLAAAGALAAFLRAMQARERKESADAIRAFLAPAMAARHAELFDRCLASAYTR